MVQLLSVEPLGLSVPAVGLFADGSLIESFASRPSLTARMLVWSYGIISTAKNRVTSATLRGLAGRAFPSILASAMPLPRLCRPKDLFASGRQQRLDVIVGEVV
jgi:hypothetical protein